MSNFTQRELQNIEFFVKAEEVNIRKLSNYAEYSVDPQIKQLFNKAGQESTNAKQKIMTFLN